MQIEVIRDLRERKMQIVLDEREGGYGIELLNYTSIEGIVGPMELGVDGKVHYIYSFGDKIPISKYTNYFTKYCRLYKMWKSTFLYQRIL